MENATALRTAATDFKLNSLTSIVGGFSFAAAIAWMDAVRWMISQVVKVPRNGGTYYLLTALFTTLLAVVIFTVVNRMEPRVKRQDPIYAVARV